MTSRGLCAQSLVEESVDLGEESRIHVLPGHHCVPSARTAACTQRSSGTRWWIRQAGRF